MNLICIGTDHTQANTEKRERVAIRPDQLASSLLEIQRRLSGPQEVAILSTCNRVEFYLATTQNEEEAKRAIYHFLSSTRQLEHDFLSDLFYHRINEACISHLFELTSGLRSMVIGETEILGQAKSSYEKAIEAGTVGKYLHRLFQHSFSAAKDARTQSGITKGSVSVASVAVDLAEQIFGSLQKKTVLILGAGETGERVARTLASRGIGMTFVANRTYDRATYLAAELGGEAVNWQEWPERLIHADMIVSSTAAPHYILQRKEIEASLKARNYHPLFLVDLAVPRNIDPLVAELDSVYLYQIDDLQTIASQHIQERVHEIERCREILVSHHLKFSHWLEMTKQHAHLPAAVIEPMQMPSYTLQ